MCYKSDRPRAGRRTETAAITPTRHATESADANDGPGGHADEPGNPNADYQFEGQQ